MNPKDLDRTIKKLSEAEHAYYVLNEPIMSDGEYDNLFNKLKQYEIENPKDLKKIQIIRTISCNDEKPNPCS